MVVDLGIGPMDRDVARIVRDNKDSIIAFTVFSYVLMYLFLGIGGITFQAQPTTAYDTCNPCSGSSSCADDEKCQGAPPGACGGLGMSISICHTLDCGPEEVARNHVCECGDDDVDFYADSACGGQDCDDSDAEKSPGNAEICDGKDNDCDGSVDEGGVCTQCDEDGDGYDADTSTCGGTDCDDSDSSINPGASESCNGVDDDCDGQVDESSEVCGGSCSYDGTCDETATTSTCELSELRFSCSGSTICDTRSTDGKSCDYEGTGTNDDTCSGGRCCVSNYGDSCGSDTGACESGTIACDGSCDGNVGPSSETCGDGVDNDCDGSVDEGCDECDKPSDCGTDSCSYSSTCDETGSRTDYTCNDPGSSTSTCSSTLVDCSRDTDGKSCGNAGDYCSGGSCQSSCGRSTCTWNDQSCGGGSCSDGEMYQTESCSDGDCSERTRCVQDDTCNSPPNAEFDYTPTDPVQTEDIQFDGSPSTDDGSITSYEWRWELGAGFTDTGETEIHAYSSGGDYNVTLRVTDDLGAVDKGSELVTVTQDNTAPSVNCNTENDGNDCDFPDPVKSGNDVTFDPDPTDDVSSESDITIEICEDSGGSPDCTDTFCTGTDSCSYTTPDNTHNTRSYWVRVTDEAGNSATSSQSYTFTMKKEEGDSCTSDDACLLGECAEDEETGQQLCEATTVPEPGIFLSFFG